MDSIVGQMAKAAAKGVDREGSPRSPWVQTSTMHQNGTGKKTWGGSKGLRMGLGGARYHTTCAVCRLSCASWPPAGRQL